MVEQPSNVSNDVKEIVQDTKDLYIVYRLTSPDGKWYIGITNNFKRRFKEHRSSKYPIGRALRKYGYQNFKQEFLFSEITLERALQIESELVGVDQVKDHDCYNVCLGGICSIMMSSEFNPMKNPDIAKNHPKLFSDKYNPIFDAKIKQKMIDSQNCKKLEIDGVVYYGVREAARKLGVSRQFLNYRLKCGNFPTYKYLNGQDGG